MVERQCHFMDEDLCLWDSLVYTMDRTMFVDPW